MERLEVVTLFKQRIAQLEQQNEELRAGCDKLLAEVAKQRGRATEAQRRARRWRKHAGGRHWKRQRCKACGVVYEMRTVGCGVCTARHRQRRLRTAA